MQITNKYFKPNQQRELEDAVKKPGPVRMLRYRFKPAVFGLGFGLFAVFILLVMLFVSLPFQKDSLRKNFWDSVRLVYAQDAHAVYRLGSKGFRCLAYCNKQEKIYLLCDTKRNTYFYMDTQYPKNIAGVLLDPAAGAHYVHIYKPEYDEKKAFLDAGGDGVWFDGLY